MDLAEQAFVEKVNGNIKAFKDLSSKALAAEKEAAGQLLLEFDKEPTRSILFRSAASLAMDCEEYITAEQLIASSLIGNPPDEIKEEIKNLYETVNFKRHLSIDGLSLSEDEFQMSISGDAVGYGVTKSHHFLDRVNSLEKIISRTSERKIGKPFRGRGRKGDEVDKYALFMSVPRAASFAVTLRIGGISDQMAFPGMSTGKTIVDEFLQCIKLFQQEDTEALRERIKDESYFTNFVGLAEQILPDGEDVKMVGFTRGSRNAQDDEENTIALTRTKNELMIIDEASILSNAKLVLEDGKVTALGFFDFADRQKQKKKIKLTGENKESHTFIVPEGMLDDIVRPLWGQEVKAKGYRKNGKLYLERIEKA